VPRSGFRPGIVYYQFSSSIVHGLGEVVARVDGVEEVGLPSFRFQSYSHQLESRDFDFVRVGSGLSDDDQIRFRKARCHASHARDFANRPPSNFPILLLYVKRHPHPI
jgi:hypothetical protein